MRFLWSFPALWWALTMLFMSLGHSMRETATGNVLSIVLLEINQ